MDEFQLNFDEQQAEILLMLLEGKSLTSAERRDIIGLQIQLENQLGDG